VALEGFAHAAVHLHRLRSGDGHGLHAGDLQVVVAAYLGHAVLLDPFMAVALDLGQPVALDHQVVVVADGGAAIVPHAHVHVLLGVHEQLFLALLVLEADLVEAFAALARHGLDGGLGLLRGQGVGRHVVGVVDAAHHDGPVGVAVQEVDDDLLADARDEHRAPLASRPDLGHAQPARAFLVAVAAAVPEEVDLDAAVLVGVDLFALGARDHGRLRAVHAAARRAQRRAVRDPVRDHRDPVGVGAGVFAAQVAQVVGAAVLHRHDQVFLVHRVDGVVFQFEHVARRQRADVAGAVQRLVLDFLGFDLHAGQLVAVGQLGIAAGVAVAFEFGVVAHADQGIDRDPHVGAGLGEVVVIGHVAAGARGEPARQPRDAVALFQQDLLVEGQRGRFQLGVVVPVVGQDHDLGIFLVAEEVVDACPFQQPRDEVEGGLAVLGAIDQVRVVLGQVQLVIREAEFLEKGLDDPGDAQVLEDARVLVQLQEPEPGHHVADVAGAVVVAVVLARLAGALEARHPAGPVALAVLGVDAQRHALAQQGGRLDVFLFRGQRQVEAKGLGQPFVSFEALDQQRVLPKRGGEVEQAFGGGDSHGRQRMV